MIRAACKGLRRVEVVSFEDLVVDCAARVGAQVMIRGIRAVSDYEYELQMALMNRKLEPQVETVFMMAAEEYSFVSSRLVKEVFTHGGDIAAFVPPLVMERMRQK